MRSLTNDAELMAALKARLRPDLELVRLENPTLEQQQSTAALMHRAVVVIAPHGGALLNMIYMRHPAGDPSVDPVAMTAVRQGPPQDASAVTGVPVVVELTGLVSGSDYSWSLPCFVYLSNGLGLRHYVVEHPGISYASPFQGNIEKVMEVLDGVGVLRSS